MLKFHKLSMVTTIALTMLLSFPLLLNNNLFDDAYIHARIVSNWMDFGFPSYLIGQDFKASSSTGYISILFLLSQFMDVLDSIVMFQICSIFLYVFAAIIILNSFNGQNKLLTLIILFSPIPFFLTASYGGMESSIILPLLLLVYIFDRRNNACVALGLVAIAVMFRFEMLSLFIPLAFSYYLEKKYKAVLAISFLLSLFFLFEISLYGTVIPYASIVKTIGYNIPIFQSFLNAISLNASPYGPHLGLLISFLLIYSIYLILQNLYESQKIDVEALKRISFILSSFAIMISWALAGSNIFKWYLIPVCSSALIFTLYSLNLSGIKKNILKVLSIVMMLGFCNIGSMTFISNQGFLDESENNRTFQLKKIGAYLYSLCPDCSLVTSEIGALGWSFKGLVYDGFGLSDPEALSFHPLKVPSERSGYGIGAIPPDYIKFRNPDFIVSLPIFIELFLEKPNKNYYKYYCKTTKAYYGEDHIIIFSRLKLDPTSLARIDCNKTI